MACKSYLFTDPYLAIKLDQYLFENHLNTYHISDRIFLRFTLFHSSIVLVAETEKKLLLFGYGFFGFF